MEAHASKSVDYLQRLSAVVYFQQFCVDLHSPLIPVFKQLPVQMTEVLLNRSQLVVLLCPGPKVGVDNVVMFVPLLE